MRGRWVGLAVVVAVCMGLGSQLPRLEVALAPERLLTAEPSGTSARLVLLVRGAGALDVDALRHVHAASRAMRARSDVLRVDSITDTPLPHAALANEARARGLTLAQLDDADEARDTARDALEHALEEALGAALATDPERFPLGLASLQPRLEWGPAVRGPTVVEADARRVAQTLERVPSLRGGLVDESGAYLLVDVRLRPELTPEQVHAAYEAMVSWTDAHPVPRGGEQHVVGLPAVRAALLGELAQDQVRLPLLAGLLSGLVLLLAFRSWAGVLLPMAAAGMACAATIGAMAALGQPLDLLTNVVPALLITLGLGDAVHLTIRYRQELRRRAPLEAASVTFRRMLVACLSTSLTTAIGFGSVALGWSGPLARFALVASAGVMTAYFVTIAFLPVALAEAPLTPDPEEGALERGLSAVAGLARRWPRAVLGASILALLGAAVVGGRVPLDAPLRAQLGVSSGARRAAARVEERFGGYRVLTVSRAGARLETAADAAELAALERWLAERPEVGRVDGPASRMRAMWGALGGDRDEALSSDARVGALSALADATATPLSPPRITALVHDEGSRRLARLADDLEERFDGVRARGEAARTARGLRALTERLVASLAAAVVLTFVVLGAFLRSARLGLVSVLPNVLPLAFAFAWMGLRGIPLQASTAIVFTICVGLAVDGTIHVLTRYREAVADGSRDPIDVAVRGSGRAVTIGALTLVAGFAALLFAASAPIRHFAEIGLVALASSWACELIVLPALLERFGAARRPPGRPR